MGGRGSGRRSSYSGKPETSDSMPLDIRRISRKGLLVPGNSFSWQWLVNDRQVAGISIRVYWQSMVLSYRMKSTGEVVEQRVERKPHPATWGASATGSPAHGAASGWQSSTRQAGTLPAASAAGWATPHRKKAQGTGHPAVPTSCANAWAGRLAS